jgi:predicted metal-dependent hydrolase
MSLKPLRRIFGGSGQPDDGPPVLEIDGREVPISYRRNARARRIIMRMDTQGYGIVLTVPEGTSPSRAFDFARSQTGWIWQRLEREAPRQAPSLHGSTIIIRGVSHVIEQASGRGVPVHIRDFPTPALMVRGEPQHLPRRITDFLKREAKADLERTSLAYARTLGVSFNQITVRDTTTRWGSCSSNGTLSFSWRLILAPPKVLDYVAAHEVAHLLEMNHGPAFWELVYRHCPHTDWSRKWLRKQGQSLHKLPF